MQERWDVVVKVLDGPLAGMGEQVFRGPVVRIGASPGPGGFQLQGYRGLDARHATITAYEGGTAAIAPLGTNQVRMAPHANVEWKEIDPMGGPEYLSEGCAVHLGPVGRGATLEFVECRKLGVWTGGSLASEATGVSTTGAGGAPGFGAPPASFDVRKSKRIRASSVPPWFIGCMVMMTAIFVAVPLAAVFITSVDIEKLGPVEEGEPFYDFADISKEQINPKLLEGLNQPFNDFVMNPNIEDGGSRKLSDPENWDQEFYDYVAASVQTHLKSWSVFKRMDVVREDYATVVGMMRDAGLPDVFAGIPYLESRYDGERQSHACAKGYWQFMPEVAWRIDRDAGFGFKVKDCKFKDADVTWSPSRPTPPPGVMKNAPYIDKNDVPLAHKCRIKSCRIDNRTDLEKSTAAAIFTLTEAWEDRDIQGSGAAVQITIASHNAGYDDSRFGSAKRSNLRPAYLRWRKGKDEDQWPWFYGQNITTPTPHEKSWEGSAIPPETQHYPYTIVAEHFLAACYYGQNYGDEFKVFKDYVQYTRGDGYCKQLNIPTDDEVKKHKSK